MNISVDYLKKKHQMIHYFGLGFIQIKIDNYLRYHFYSPELPPITESPHNHRYSFISEILHGTIENTVYGLVKGSTHILRNESCSKDSVAEGIKVETSIKELHTKKYNKGQSYFMPYTVFHTVKADNCITKLTRSNYRQKYAQVIGISGKETVCPFSKEIKKEDLWDIVNYMLKEIR